MTVDRLIKAAPVRGCQGMFDKSNDWLRMLLHISYY
jgi:hypothetical protein